MYYLYLYSYEGRKGDSLPRSFYPAITRPRSGFSFFFMVISRAHVSPDMIKPKSCLTLRTLDQNRGLPRHCRRQSSPPRASFLLSSPWPRAFSMPAAAPPPDVAGNDDQDMRILWPHRSDSATIVEVEVESTASRNCPTRLSLFVVAVSRIHHDAVSFSFPSLNLNACLSWNTALSSPLIVHISLPLILVMNSRSPFDNHLSLCSLPLEAPCVHGRGSNQTVETQYKITDHVIHNLRYIIHISSILLSV